MNKRVACYLAWGIITSTSVAFLVISCLGGGSHWAWTGLVLLLLGNYGVLVIWDDVTLIDRITETSIRPFRCPVCKKVADYVSLDERREALHGGTCRLKCPNGHEFTSKDPLSNTRSILSNKYV